MQNMHKAGRPENSKNAGNDVSKPTLKDAADRINNYSEAAKNQAHIIVEIVEYIPNSMVSKTIIKRATGNITAMSFAIGEELEEKMSPFDIYIQIIDGKAEIILNGKTHNLDLGSGFVIPANLMHRFTAKEQFKMICTVIKSGYDI